MNQATIFNHYVHVRILEIDRWFLLLCVNSSSHTLCSLSFINAKFDLNSSHSHTFTHLYIYIDTAICILIMNPYTQIHAWMSELVYIYCCICLRHTWHWTHTYSKHCMHNLCIEIWTLIQYENILKLSLLQ